MWNWLFTEHGVLRSHLSCWMCQRAGFCLLLSSTLQYKCRRMCLTIHKDEEYLICFQFRGVKNGCERSSKICFVLAQDLSV